MRSRWLSLVLLAASLASVTPAARGGTWHDDQRIEHDGLTRLFRIFEPSLPPPPEGYPLVFILHGGSGTYRVMDGRGFTEWTAIADEAAVLLAVPNGAPNGVGGTPWDDCRLPGVEPVADADDVGFFEVLIEELGSRHPVDSRRVYATGASNGGQMSYRIALELGERIAAVAPIVATLPAESECRQPAGPVAVMIVNGDDDPLTAWNGGCAENDAGCARGGKLSAFATRDLWIAWNGASPTPTSEVVFDDIDTADRSTVEATFHAGAGARTEVRLYRVRGGGHHEPTIAHARAPLPPPLLFGFQNRDVEIARETWDFFTPHVLPDRNDAPGSVGRLEVSRAAGDGLELTWEPDCGGGASHAIYRGDLRSGPASPAVEPESCRVNGSSAWVPRGDGEADYFLVVPHDGASEGSRGTRSDGAPRAAGPAPCLPPAQPARCADDAP